MRRRKQSQGYQVQFVQTGVVGHFEGGDGIVGVEQWDSGGLVRRERGTSPLPPMLHREEKGGFMIMERK